jgi:hypothetical protein
LKGNRAPLWVRLRGVFRVRRSKFKLRQREDELRQARSDTSALRCALASQISERESVEAVRDAYVLSDRQFRTAIDEVAIPALIRSGERCADIAGERGRLEAALPERVDEEQVRSMVWAMNGWH